MTYTGWNDPFDVFFTATSNKSDARINVGHNPREVMLQVALPGFSRSDIDVEVNANRLTVRAKGQAPTGDYEFTTHEIGMKEYSRTWSLPKNANTDAVVAEYDAGVLTVRIPYLTNNRDTVRKIELN
jgi:HSP20 family protein